MRLIDADTLKTEMTKPIPYDKEIADKLWEGWHECTIAVDRLINNAPTIEPKWIPCSERLPSENGDYLVTLENGVVKILGYSTTQRTTYPKGFYYIKDGFSWRHVQNPVVAWMPKPEPWKGAEE